MRVIISPAPPFAFSTPCNSLCNYQKPVNLSGLSIEGVRYFSGVLAIIGGCPLGSNPLSFVVQPVDKRGVGRRKDIMMTFTLCKRIITLNLLN